jgi:hypothetical protein
LSNTLAIFPGQKTWFGPSLFTKFIETSIRDFPDTNKNSTQRVIAVDVIDAFTDSPTVFVATPAKLWTYSPKSVIWDSLPSTLADTQINFRYFQNVYASRSGDTFDLYAAIKIKKASSKSDTIGFFKYDTSAHSWNVYLENLENVPPVSFGPSHELYLSVGNQVHLFKDTNNQFNSIWGSDIFQKRMTRHRRRLPQFHQRCSLPAKGRRQNGVMDSFIHKLASHEQWIVFFPR